MIQLRTQKPEYWGASFALKESDIEQIYNHLLEVETPQSIAQLTRMVIASRVAIEVSQAKKKLAGGKIYQPQLSFEVGETLIMPALNFTQSQVEAIRTGYNPQYGEFKVVQATVNGKHREFAMELTIEHPLNDTDITEIVGDAASDLDTLQEQYGPMVAQKLSKKLADHPDFIRLSGQWFVKTLLPDINIGHLHLADAILDMNEGGPLSVDEILPHLDLDASIDINAQRFAVNLAMLNDSRFDEVGSSGEVLWFLNRLEPDEVRKIPERLQYEPIPYDPALLNSELLMLERELDDEWADTKPYTEAQPVIFSLTYPHRWAGTIPLSARIRPLFSVGDSPRQRILFIDEHSQKEIVGWVVAEGRYVFGLKEWYQENGVPIGGFVHLKPGPKPGVILLGHDRRRSQREWVRLATVNDNRLKFELKRRDVACGYDDLMIVGTDVVTAVDTLWRRAESSKRPVVSLLLEIFPELASMNPQKTVHAKTLYSTINMLRRIPPGPLFAELVRHPAFQSVGDHYWLFDSSRIQKKIGTPGGLFPLNGF